MAAGHLASPGTSILTEELPDIVLHSRTLLHMHMHTLTNQLPTTLHTAHNSLQRSVPPKSLQLSALEQWTRSSRSLSLGVAVVVAHQLEV